MARSRFALLLLCACFAFGTLAARPAAAGAFAPKWSVAGWTYLASLGSTDGDPQPELLFYSDTDGHYAIFDGLTGALGQEFPDFDYPNCNLAPLDIDGDGRPELFFWGGYFGPALCIAYHWDGSGYSVLFQHTDRIDSIWLGHVRSATQFDLIEYASDDTRVRDLTGVVVWRASQNVLDQPPYYCIPCDLDNNGIEELFFQGGNNALHLFKYSGGSIAHQWTVPNQFITWVETTENTAAYQVGTINAVDGHFAVVEAATGALVADFPDYTSMTGAQFRPVELNPNGGRHELILWQPPSVVPPVAPKFKALRWDGTGYVTMFSHTDPITDWFYASFRSIYGSEFVETDQNGGEVRIRDDLGNVLFRASTGIPGWTTGPRSYLVAGPADFVHDGSGLVRLLIDDDFNALRLVGYSGTFSQTWVANGWSAGTLLGNTDDDPQDEMLALNFSNQNYGILDGLNGGLSTVFTDYSASGTGAHVYDANNDGKNEVLMYRLTVSPGDPPPLLDLFQSYGPGYVSMFQLTDSLLGISPVQLRDGTQHELLQVSPSGDMLLRDGLDGHLLFKASTDLPGWIPLDLNGSTPLANGDFDGDGVEEVLITDNGTSILLDYSGTTAVPGSGAPSVFRVLPSAPNPFRTATTLRLELPRAGQVGVRVFDTAGRLVRRLDRTLPAGPNAIEWDGLDEAGRPAPNGVLFYQVTADGRSRTSKLVRLR